jgi:hypothetical protein
MVRSLAVSWWLTLPLAALAGTLLRISRSKALSSLR